MEEERKRRSLRTCLWGEKDPARSLLVVPGQALLHSQREGDRDRDPFSPSETDRGAASTISFLGWSWGHLEMKPRNLLLGIFQGSCSFNSHVS